MNKETRIKLVKNLDVTDMAGDKVMVDFDSGKYFLLKGTAVDIWDCIQKETTVTDITNHLQKIYDVDEETCMSGVITFLDQLHKNNFIEIT